MKKHQTKVADIILETGRSESGSLITARLKTKTRTEFLKAASEWWDNYGTGYCDYDRFMARMTWRDENGEYNP